MPRFAPAAAAVLGAALSAGALIAPARAQTPPFVYTDRLEVPGSVYHPGAAGERRLYRAPAGNVFYAAVGPDGALYFTNANDRTVMRWSGGSPDVLYTHTTYVRDLGFDPAGRLYFSEATGAAADGRIYRLENGAAVLYRTVPRASTGGTWAGNFVFAPDGTLYLSTGNTVGAGIYRAGPQTGTMLVYSDAAGPIGGLDVDAAGNVYYASWQTRIYRVTPGGVRSVVLDKPGRAIADVHLLRSAVALGPGPGRVNAVGTVPGNPNVLYAATSGGGIYRSANRGRSWEWRSRGITHSRTGDVLVYPPATSTVLAVTPAGVFRSTDEGRSWAQTLTVPRAVPPLAPGVPVAQFDAGALRWSAAEGAVYAAPYCAGLWRSPDGSGGWTQVFGAGVATVDRCVTSVETSPAGGGTVYITTPAGMRQRVAGGAWTAIGAEITDGTPLLVRAAPSTPDRLYAASFGLGSSPYHPTIWRRDAAGSPFVRTTASPPWPDGFLPLSLVVNPVDPTQVFHGTIIPYRYGNSAWTEFRCNDSSVCGADYRGLTLDAAGTTLYAAHDQGIFRWEAAGNTFAAADTGLINGEVYALDVGPGGTVYATTQDLGAFRRGAAETAWTQTASHGSGDVLDVVVDPGNDLHVFERTNEGVVLRSSNGAAMVDSSATLPFQGFWNHQLAYHAASGTLYTGSLGHGVYRSTDGGMTFVPANTGMASVTTRAVAIQPGGSGSTLYAGTFTQGVWRTTTGGSSWTQLGSFPQPGALSFAFTPDGSRVYAGTQSGVYLSTDGGGSWAPRSSGLPAGAVVSELLVDPACACRIYAGLGYYDVQNRYEGGVYESVDGGTSWSRISSEWEAAVPVTSIRIDPLDPSRLYVSTFGAGVRVLLRSLAPGCTCP